MNQITPEMQNLALWLLAQEVVDGKPTEEKMNETFRVCEKLRGFLTTLIGAAGYRSLISRALALGKNEAILLQTVQVKEDGSLGWTGTLELPQRMDEAPDDGSVLVAQLLGLLITFIGQALMLRLVRELWPDAPFENIHSKTEI
jgi:hypothetical protein